MKSKKALYESVLISTEKINELNIALEQKKDKASINVIEAEKENLSKQIEDNITKIYNLAILGERMILKEDSTEQKLRGAYYTPLKLAEKMVDFFKKDASIKSILEPSCGDGVFVDALIETQFLTQNRKVTAIEIEKNEAKKVAEKLKNNLNVSVVNRDFFEFYQKYKDINKYDLILGNPPYIRYQYLEEKQRMEMAEILTSHGMKANKLINTWVGFMVACVHMLSDNGKIAFVIQQKFYRLRMQKI